MLSSTIRPVVNSVAGVCRIFLSTALEPLSTENRGWPRVSRIRTTPCRVSVTMAFMMRNLAVIITNDSRYSARRVGTSENWPISTPVKGETNAAISPPM